MLGLSRILKIYFELETIENVSLFFLMVGVRARGTKFPVFEFNGTSNYGDFAKEQPPNNRHFIPRMAKLKVLYIFLFSSFV